MFEIIAVIFIVIAIIVIATTPDDEYDNHYPDNEI